MNSESKALAHPFLFKLLQLMFVAVLFSSAGCATISEEDKQASNCDNLGSIQRIDNSPNIDPRRLIPNIKITKSHYAFAGANSKTFTFGQRTNYERDIESCDLALQSFSEDENWLRKVTLLRSKAAFLYVSEQDQKALTTVQNAKALTDQYARGSKLRGIIRSLNLIEAVLLANTASNNTQEKIADIKLLEMADFSSYSRSVLSLVLTHLSIEALLNNHTLDLFQQIAKLSPNSRTLMLDLLLWRDNDADSALTYYDTLLQEGFSVNKTVLEAKKRISEHDSNVDFNGQTLTEKNIKDPTIFAKASVAATLLGEFKKAQNYRDQLGKAIDTLDFALHLPNYKNEAILNALKIQIEELQSQTDYLITTAKNLEFIQTHSKDEVLKKFVNQKLEFKGATGFHYYQAMHQKTGLFNNEKIQEYRINALKKGLQESRKREQVAEWLYSFYPMYSEDTLKSQPGALLKSLINPRENGYEVSDEGHSSIKVEYKGETSSIANVQELSILAGAITAQERGYDYVLIDSMLSFRRTSGFDRGMGFSADLYLSLLNSESPNAHNAFAIKVQDILDALLPKYSQ